MEATLTSPRAISSQIMQYNVVLPPAPPLFTRIANSENPHLGQLLEDFSREFRLFVQLLGNGNDFVVDKSRYIFSNQFFRI